MGRLRRIDGQTEYGARRTALRMEEQAQDAGQVLRAIHDQLVALNQAVAWQNQALAQLLNERANASR